MKLRSLTVSTFLLLASITSACGSQDQTTDLSAQSDTALPVCQLSTNCSQTLPYLPAPVGFSGFYKKLITKTGKPLHRARDVVALPGAPIWLHAKFSYGILDADLHEEKVDIYLSQGCASGLKKIGSAITSLDGQNPTVEGVEDTGGRIFVNLATLGVNNLPVGRHRVVFVVPGDNSSTELYINVVDPRQKIVISDIDGTLTASELAAAGEIVGANNEPRPGSVAALQTLADKGYHIVYLTARPEWLMAKTRSWLVREGYPAGTVRTTTLKVPASGTPATVFKVAEMKLIEDETGIIPSLAIGNKDTDVEAFVQAGIPGSGSYYHDLGGNLEGGASFNDYDQLNGTFQNLAAVCQK